MALALALIPQGLGLGLDLVTCVLGLGLGSQVLVNITEKKSHKNVIFHLFAQNGYLTNSACDVDSWTQSSVTNFVTIYSRVLILQVKVPIVLIGN